MLYISTTPSLPPLHTPPQFNHIAPLHSTPIYSSSLALPSLRSGIPMTFTAKLVHPVKCCVRWPLPVSGLYCSQANPVSFQLSYTVVTIFRLKSVYSCFARD